MVVVFSYPDGTWDEFETDQETIDHWIQRTNKQVSLTQ